MKILVVTKCDGDLVPAARRMAMEYTSALKFMRPRYYFYFWEDGAFQ